MKYAIFIYGQFRTFEKNLEHNLKEIYNSIIENNLVDIFILTDTGGNYSDDNANKIKKIFEQYNCNVKFIKLWEEQYKFHLKEMKTSTNYIDLCKEKKGYHIFTANLWYRRYVTNILVNNFCNEHNINYDLHMFMRLFDIRIDKNNNDIFIKNNIEKCLKEEILLMSIDTIFIGKKNIIDYIFSFGENFNIYNENIWNNEKFTKIYNNIDYCLNMIKPTYCSEVQIFSHIFFSSIKYQNIRYDYNNPNNIENINTLFHVKLCNDRK